MSLNWDISKVSGKDGLCWIGDPDEDGKRYLNPVTDALIWATMAVGMGEITERNAEQFFRRLRAWELAIGSMLRMPRETADGIVMDDYMIEPSDIVAHVGLKTNVFPMETDAKFARKLTDALLGRARDAWRAHERAAVAEREALASATD